MKSKFYIMLMLLTTFWSAAFAIAFTTSKAGGSSQKSIAVEAGVQYQLSFDLLHQNTSDVRFVISDGSAVTYIDESNLVDGNHTYSFVPSTNTIVVKFVRVDNDNISRTFEVNNLNVGKLGSQAEVFNTTIGKKGYKIVDHLGNVRVLVGDGLVSGKTVVESAVDYLPFGMEARTFGTYVRYEYNGKEIENELSEGAYDFGERMYIGKLGRFFKVDPMSSATSWNSPYLYGLNSPISVIDEKGLLGVVVTGTGRVTLLIITVAVNVSVVASNDGFALSIGPEFGVGAGLYGGAGVGVAFYPSVTKCNQLSGWGSNIGGNAAVGIGGGFDASASIQQDEKGNVSGLKGGLGGGAGKMGAGAGAEGHFSATYTFMSPTLTYDEMKSLMEDMGLDLGLLDKAKNLNSSQGLVAKTNKVPVTNSAQPKNNKVSYSVNTKGGNLSVRSGASSGSKVITTLAN
ncbi:MAG: hypothetical protein NT150_01480, partial [Bacteroidetes bacterium]|nr:hypothetical protein [Bacteroidota bacterium]